jgi:uncharacterized alkaline shock family protein YloU
MPSSDLKLPFSSPQPAGALTIAHQVIAKLAGKAARSTYGVVGMQESPIHKLTHLFRSSVTDGVEIGIEGASVNIALHVVMERGVNLAQVTANLREQVRYQVADIGGVPLGEVSVHVEDLQD